MNRREIEQLIIDAICEVAPDVSPEDVEAEEDIRESCDLDSMDFLNCLEALKQSTGVSIPETDYQQIATFNALADYLLNACEKQAVG